ncbi:MAG: acyltransferase [Bacteroidales bacterium]|nr:acyltransferase [Bacteroidales bacterium]
MRTISYIMQEGWRRFFQMIVGGQLFSLPGLYYVRWLFYHISFGIPYNCVIGYNVVLHRQHGMSSGTFRIGEHCTLADNVKVDYSGGFSMGEHSSLSEGTIVWTHTHNVLPIDRESPIPTPLTIANNVWCGTGSIILAGTKSIGENSIIEAGTVVRKRVKKNVIVGGNPMQIISELPSCMQN